MQNKIFIAGLQKQSFIDYPGKVSCVIFLAGCNMRCHYCHNAQLFDGGENKIPFDEALNFIDGNKKLLDAVVVSGGEPTVYPYLFDILTELKKRSLNVKLDTNGTNYLLVKKIADNGLADYIALDIKAPFDKFKDITGTVNITDIIETIKFLKNQNKTDYMFRTTLSPMLNEKDIEIMGKEMINGAKVWQLQQFVPNDYSNSQKTVFLPLRPQNVRQFAEIAKKYALNVVVRGL
jgi:pyruvate formate lyase activating enzyme